jgi:hypothetical protein
MLSHLVSLTFLGEHRQSPIHPLQDNALETYAPLRIFQ